MTMLRGSLIAALFHQMLSLPVEGVSESAAMALMGSDAEAFAEYFHTTITDTWADILQLSVAIYLIARMTGAVVVAPVIVAVCEFNAYHFISRCCVLDTLTLPSLYVAVISCW
jgi:hypothetical protein